MAESTQLERAIKAIEGRRPAPPPETDFTLHQLENGVAVPLTVSTQERVVKEVPSSFLLVNAYDLTGGDHTVGMRNGNSPIGSNPVYEHPDRRAILLQNGKGQAGHRLP
jgi:hypothetical protein